jgi:hypothetical protein
MVRRDFWPWSYDGNADRLVNNLSNPSMVNFDIQSDGLLTTIQAAHDCLLHTIAFLCCSRHLPQLKLRWLPP